MYKSCLKAFGNTFSPLAPNSPWECNEMESGSAQSPLPYSDCDLDPANA